MILSPCFVVSHCSFLPSSSLALLVHENASWKDKYYVSEVADDAIDQCAIVYFAIDQVSTVVLILFGAFHFSLLG